MCRDKKSGCILAENKKQFWYKTTFNSFFYIYRYKFKLDVFLNKYQKQFVKTNFNNYIYKNITKVTHQKTKQKKIIMNNSSDFSFYKLQSYFMCVVHMAKYHTLPIVCKKDKKILSYAQ